MPGRDNKELTKQDILKELKKIIHSNYLESIDTDDENMRYVFHDLINELHDKIEELENE